MNTHLEIFIQERILHQSIRPCFLKSSLQFGIFVQFKIFDHFLIEGKECCASSIGDGRCLPSPIVGDLDTFFIHRRHLNRPVWVPHTQFVQQHVPHFEGMTWRPLLLLVNPLESGDARVSTRFLPGWEGIMRYQKAISYFTWWPCCHWLESQCHAPLKLRWSWSTCVIRGYGSCAAAKRCNYNLDEVEDEEGKAVNPVLVDLCD